jgi:hypothetical protein
MSLELFALTLVVGVASGLIYAVAIARGRKYQQVSGKELGEGMRKELEENWKRHVLAGVVAVGCGLYLSFFLKLPPYTAYVAGFISYLIVDYALSKLFKKVKMG